tara:strand:+ start:3605 stop:4744 length:1140 start_codon:yes stop_codon:yes gene_type:complete
MNWTTILKRKKMHAKNFKTFKKVLIELVEAMPNDEVFTLNTFEVKRDLIERLKNENLQTNSLAIWEKTSMDNWIKSVGNRIVSNMENVDVVSRNDRQYGRQVAFIKKTNDITKNLKLVKPEVSGKVKRKKKPLPDFVEDEKEKPPVNEEEISPDCLMYYKRITVLIVDFVTIDMPQILNKALKFGYWDKTGINTTYNFEPDAKTKTGGKYPTQSYDFNYYFSPTDSTNYKDLFYAAVDFTFTKSENIPRKDACTLLWLIHSGGWTPVINDLDWWPQGMQLQLNTYDSIGLKNAGLDLQTQIMTGGSDLPSFGIQLYFSIVKKQYIRYNNLPDEIKKVLTDIHFDVRKETRELFKKIQDIADEWVNSNPDFANKFRLDNK